MNCHDVRAEMPRLDVQERIRSFQEVELGFSAEQAVEEARRCLGCEVELCVGCRICAEVCPDSCISIKTAQSKEGKDYVTSYVINSTTCMFCGLCAEACPTKTLHHTGEYELSTFGKESLLYVMKADNLSTGDT